MRAHTLAITRPPAVGPPPDDKHTLPEALTLLGNSRACNRRPSAGTPPPRPGNVRWTACVQGVEQPGRRATTGVTDSPKARPKASLIAATGSGSPTSPWTSAPTGQPEPLLMQPLPRPPNPALRRALDPP